jgi:hypothetical protein
MAHYNVKLYIRVNYLAKNWLGNTTWTHKNVLKDKRVAGRVVDMLRAIFILFLPYGQQLNRLIIQYVLYKILLKQFVIVTLIPAQ